jgi:hypothetical protein
VADYLAEHYDDRVDRRVKTGAKDRGDIGGLRTKDGRRIVLECKNTTRTDLAGWATELADEIENDQALTGAVIHKRHGIADPAKQWVTLTLEQLVWLLKGER